VQLSEPTLASIYVRDATQEFRLRATHAMEQALIAEVIEQKLSLATPGIAARSSGASRCIFRISTRCR